MLFVNPQQRAINDRGKHDEIESAEVMEKAAIEEVRALRKPSKFDLGDGLSTAGWGTAFGLGASYLVDKAGDDIPLQYRLPLKIAGTAIGAVCGYRWSQEGKIEYANERLNDANHEATQAKIAAMEGRLTRTMNENGEFTAEQMARMENRLNNIVQPRNDNVQTASAGVQKSQGIQV